MGYFGALFGVNRFGTCLESPGVSKNMGYVGALFGVNQYSTCSENPAEAIVFYVTTAPP